MNQEPIFLIGLHKSGTSLLRSIFDGHSQLFVIPIEAHFFRHLGFWMDYGIQRRLPKTLGREQIIRNLTDYIIYKNTTVDKYSDSVTKDLWDVEKFAEELNRLAPGSEADAKGFIEADVHAMYSSLNHGDPLPDSLRIIEKSVDHAEYAMELKRMFPNAKFIHILRNPYSNLVSIRKFKGRKRYPSLKNIVQSMYNNYYYLESNKRVLGDDYYILKYEDLVTDTESVIHKIIDYIGIQDEPTLYRPTANGRAWSGNSTSNRSFSSISSAQLDTWKSDILPLEVSFVNRQFSYVLEKYGYTKVESRSSLLRPRFKEDLVRYLQNRLFYKFFL